MRRLLEYTVTVLVILTINFFLPRLMPGDFLTHISAEAGEVLSPFSAEQRAYFISYYGLDRPLTEQYLAYLWGVLRGDLGRSYYFNDSVASMIARRLPWSLLLVALSTCLGTFLGIVLGSLSAWRRGEWQDTGLFAFMTAFSEIPPFITGVLLLLVLSGQLGLFPLSGAMTHFAAHLSPLDRALDLLYHAALPVLTLSLALAGTTYRLVRNSLITVMRRDYIRTARAKGVGEVSVRYRHALRNALLPLVSTLALQFRRAVGGAVLVETVFAYPGLGGLMREAVYVRDYPLLQGALLLVALATLTANHLADAIYRRVDPRLQ